MEEIIKQIADILESADELTKKRILNMLGRNEAMEVEYHQYQDSLGSIYTADCPNCGNNLKFERYSQFVAPYNYCYHCGQKLLKKIKE